jgi:hypothetical protein
MIGKAVLVFLTLLLAFQGWSGKRIQRSRIIVVGDDIAAGNGDFTWNEEMQRSSFPALIAKQASIEFSQPLIEMPGIETDIRSDSVASFPEPQQTTVILQSGLVSNLSIPRYRIAEAESRRPKSPLLNQDDRRQTLMNLVFGGKEYRDKERGPTLVEAAVAQQPNLVIIELGYSDALEALETRELKSIRDTPQISHSFRRMVQSFKAVGASVVICTIPDPSDTGYLADLETVGGLTRAEPDLVRRVYGLNPDTWVSLPGIFQIGYGLINRQQVGRINPAYLFSRSELAALSAAVHQVNDEIVLIARQNDATLYDLAGLFHRVKTGEFRSRGIDAEPLGGFFGLNGRFPSRTGQAIIANDLINVLNQWVAGPLPVIDIAAIAASDPATRIQRAGDRVFAADSFRPLSSADVPALPKLDVTGVIGFVPATNIPGCRPPAGVPPCGLPDPALKEPLRLPAMHEETLDLDSDSSFYGDALKMVDCPMERPLPGFENLPTFGTCPNPLFGGVALGDSHLHGQVRIHFSEIKNGISHFQITHPTGLSGDNSTLASPVLFQLPLQLNRLDDVSGLVSSGDLELTTGRVTNLQYFTRIFNTALWALVSVNPNISPKPVAFPGPAGSASVHFEARSDGLLDFTLTAQTFLPLGTQIGGREVRLPLPLCSPDFRCASIVARGASLHPHIILTTKHAGWRVTCNGECPTIPENVIREFTVQSEETSFGDRFQFNSALFGGSATGNAHLIGRVRIQFGPRSRSTVPILLQLLPPAGMMVSRPTILEQMPPGTSLGLIGFDSVLKFPKISYQLRHLGLSTDPIDLSVGAVNLQTGEIVSELLHRGLILQDLIIQLMQVEPCTPRSSFCFRGRSRFLKGPTGLEIIFDGRVTVPYPEGYRFPGPDGYQVLPAGPSARLDPFFHLRAFESSSNTKRAFAFAGYANNLSDTSGNFSIHYSIPCGSKDNGSFIYTTNATDKFELKTFTSVSCAKSDLGIGYAQVVTFTGIGGWKRNSTDEAQYGQVSAQILRDVRGTHAAVLIDAGASAHSIGSNRPRRANSHTAILPAQSARR